MLKVLESLVKYFYLELSKLFDRSPGPPAAACTLGGNAARTRAAGLRPDAAPGEPGRRASRLMDAAAGMSWFPGAPDGNSAHRAQEPGAVVRHQTGAQGHLRHGVLDPLAGLGRRHGGARAR